MSDWLGTTTILLIVAFLLILAVQNHQSQTKPTAKSESDKKPEENELWVGKIIDFPQAKSYSHFAPGGKLRISYIDNDKDTIHADAVVYLPPGCSLVGSIQRFDNLEYKIEHSGFAITYRDNAANATRTLTWDWFQDEQLMINDLELFIDEIEVRES